MIEVHYWGIPYAEFPCSRKPFISALEETSHKFTGALVSQLISFKSKSNPIVPPLPTLPASKGSPIPGISAVAASTAPLGVGGGALAGLGPSFSVQCGALGVGILLTVGTEVVFGRNVDNGPAVVVDEVGAAARLFWPAVSVILSANISSASTQRWTSGERGSNEWMISSAWFQDVSML